MKKANVRISRPMYGCGKERIEIEIGCKSSGNEIISVQIALDDFSKILTGQSRTGDINFLVKEEHFKLLGKTREILRVSIDKPDSWNWKPTREQVGKELHTMGYLPDWILWQDGLDTQQNDQGKHNVILCRYVDEEAENDS